MENRLNIQSANGIDVLDWFSSGASEVAAHIRYLNLINVFPVADGDTGTNMATTLRAMVETPARDPSFSQMLQRLSQAGLESARGNSGLIFASYVSGLAQESRNVYKELQKQDLPAARKAVARIVGRDTQNLTAEGVTKAAVETVAENASDGVIAPLLYMLLGGAPLALTYKAINTMDSMLGYKNQKYLYFGRAAARLDDVANYLPSRLAGLLWVAAAALTGSSARGAWKIWRRDRRNHASPNSAQTESACAGALGVQLAGPAYYFGEYYDKPTIGDALRPVEPKDILRADRMMYAESLLALVLGIALRLLVLAM